MAGSSQRVCPVCGSIITIMREGLYVCRRAYCHWKGTETPIYYIEFLDAVSGESRSPIYQGTGG